LPRCLVRSLALAATVVLPAMIFFNQRRSCMLFRAPHKNSIAIRRVIL